jgi:hypothetical protein
VAPPWRVKEVLLLAHPTRGHLINQTTEATAVGGGGGGAVIISPALGRTPAGKRHRDRLSVSAAMSPQHPWQVFGSYAVAVPGNLEPVKSASRSQPSPQLAWLSDIRLAASHRHSR